MGARVRSASSPVKLWRDPTKRDVEDEVRKQGLTLVVVRQNEGEWNDCREFRAVGRGDRFMVLDVAMKGTRPDWRGMLAVLGADWVRQEGQMDGHNPYMTASELESWRRGDETRIEEYSIVPKRDFGKLGFYDARTRSNISAGWIVKKGGCNAIPGAGWYKTLDEAVVGLNLLIASKGEAEVFHALTAALYGMAKVVARREQVSAS